MKFIVSEQSVLPEWYLTYLRSRNDFPKRDVIEVAGKKIEREWWSPDHYNFVLPGDDTVAGLNLEQRVKDLDESNVDMQVLSFSLRGIEELDVSKGTSLAKRANDELSHVVRQYPKNFAGWAAIAPKNPNAAADELERAITKLGLRGVKIGNILRGDFLDDQKYWVIFERAENLGVPIMISGRIPPLDMFAPYNAQPIWSRMLLGFHHEASLHALRLIGSGLFDRYPRLKIILGFLGEGLPFFLHALEFWPRGDRAMTYGVKDLRKTPAQYFRDNFYVNTWGMSSQPVLQFVVSVLGADKILIGALDFGPMKEMVEKTIHLIEGMPISDSDKEKIFHLNAEKLLRL